MLEKLRARDGDFADMWEIGRGFATQAETYRSVRTKFQKKIDDASNIQVRGSLGGIANGTAGRFATIDIEK